MQKAEEKSAPDWTKKCRKYNEKVHWIDEEEQEEKNGISGSTTRIGVKLSGLSPEYDISAVSTLYIKTL